MRSRDGGQLVEQVLTNRGGPERPLSYQELTTMFRDNAARLLDAEVVESVHRTVAGLDTLDAVGDLTGRLASAAANPDH